MCIQCDIIAAGREARITGETPGVCPYSIGSVQALLWMQGWIEEDGDHIEVALALELQTRREKA